MKRNQICLILCLVLYFMACDSNVRFKAAQPAFTENEQAFDVDLIGNYQMNTGLTNIEITENSVMQTNQFPSMVAISELDTMEGLILTDSSIYIPVENKTYRCKRIGDSLEVMIESIDTIFEISSGQVLRKYKGYFFLNTKGEDDYWTLQILSLEGDELSFTTLEIDEENLKEFKRLTEVEVINDGTEDNYLLDPTKKEFKKLLKSNFFGDKGQFVRIQP